MFALDRFDSRELSSSAAAVEAFLRPRSVAVIGASRVMPTRSTGDFGVKNGIRVSIEIDPAIAAELSSSAGEIIQLAREALSNVGRHAEARAAHVAPTREGTATVLEIRNDGKGFDTTRRRRAGYEGLTNLRKRATSLAGHARIDSVSGVGTTVRITLPA
jgi:signal transduction histidine kinase